MALPGRPEAMEMGRRQPYFIPGLIGGNSEVVPAVSQKRSFSVLLWEGYETNAFTGFPVFQNPSSLYLCLTPPYAR
jgi:hypothetical protein